ncbi:helix-turn-helix domain-containing protein [Clostridium butyricum]|uniref:helix-turn-helix domain-containing protein n=1 Tax=Clostridium butyricum TaxID=1492 RepID=UPI002AAF970C|nr:helix-turn-helix transcriptional regulator [Clostridium butyricum]
MNERFALIRKKLGLTTRKFGERLNLTGGAITNMEKGTRGITDRTISDVCREFNVNENWLRTGEGEMFLELSRAEMAASIVGKLLSEDDEFIQNVFIALGQMSSEEWKVIKGIVEKIKNS